jgi:hypothetical protein
MVAMLVILATGVLLLGMFGVVHSFGRYTRRIIESNARTRVVCAESVEAAEDCVRQALRSERRIADDQIAQIELVREMMKANRESA